MSNGLPYKFSCVVPCRSTFHVNFYFDFCANFHQVTLKICFKLAHMDFYMEIYMNQAWYGSPRGNLYGNPFQTEKLGQSTARVKPPEPKANTRCGLANFPPVKRILFFLTLRPKMTHSHFCAGRECGTFGPVWGKMFMELYIEIQMEHTNLKNVYRKIHSEIRFAYRYHIKSIFIYLFNIIIWENLPFTV